ncbi:CoA-binding protein [Clostridium fermenticellae]|uniref:CoA-binding protein n=1 Tax=Clostridium fermenticellae TaxID=2068654 RepID=A0A386H410_9CLOT|nr:acetate--CoA ligase family protein [Clostridium fermenticellae]AYD40384.1 CoA-binding protein [Clostridium fermenticellae]
MDLKKLLQPNTIAVIGASEKEGFGGDTCRNIIEYVKDLKNTFFINPKRDYVFNRPCYKSLSDVSVDIDMIVICTPKKTVEPLLIEASKKGCMGAVVFASGYSETGNEDGKKAEESLKKLCKKLNIALMGPNCAGFVNYINNVYPFAFISKKRDRKGNVGLISQSGQICLSLMETQDMRFSYIISAGNGNVITMEDYIDFLVEDKNTKVVSIYLEGVKEPKKFINSLKKAAVRRKPIVVLKAGRSEKGRKNAASHTGSLAGSDKTFDAIFKKYGVIRVDDIEELMATSNMFSIINKLPEKPTFASMNLSGGETGVCADTGYTYGVQFPDFTEETLIKLKEQLPSYASPNNPLDMTASLSYDAELYANALRTIMNDENIGTVLIGYTLLLEIADPAIYYMAEGIKKVVEEGNSKPIIMLPFLENTRNYEYTEKLRKIGVPILPPSMYAFKIVKHLADFIEYEYNDRTLKTALPEYNNLQKTKALSEIESKNLLRKYGMPVGDAYIVKDESEALDAAQKLGYPLVMKIESADILHKSDVGGVKLNINSEKEVLSTYHEILVNVSNHKPEAKINGILMEKMMPKGMEVIIGVNNDAQFGPMVLVGLGGVFVEIFKDVSLYPAPINKAEAEKMLKKLKSYKMLTGYRGGLHYDLEALKDMIVKISNFADKNKNVLSEVDINPLFVYPEGSGVKVADAVVIMKD